MIELTFDRFNLDPKLQLVRVRNGAKTSARLLVFHTGNSAPPTVQSTSNVLRLEFESMMDDDVEGKTVEGGRGARGKGFVARYVTLGMIFVGRECNLFSCKSFHCHRFSRDSVVAVDDAATLATCNFPCLCFLVCVESKHKI